MQQMSQAVCEVEAGMYIATAHFLNMPYMRGQCYDLKNIFAEKFVEKNSVFDSNYCYLGRQK
jgi:hypothetical protein